MVIFWWFWLDVFACWILHHHIDVFVMVDISGCDWMRNCVCLSGTDIVCIRVTEITFLISAWASDTVTWPENSLLAVAVKSINRCDLSVCQTLTMSNQLNYSVCRSNMFYSLLRFSKGRRGDGGGGEVCVWGGRGPMSQRLSSHHICLVWFHVSIDHNWHWPHLISPQRRHTHCFHNDIVAACTARPSSNFCWFPKWFHRSYVYMKYLCGDN